MATKDIIVIGASAGGLDALKKLIGGLPENLQASVFIVWHISPYVTGILPDVLNKHTSFYVSHPVDGEKIKSGRIYVAPPDHHLIVEPEQIRVTKGPKENRFRPAIDPLFRSAAYSYDRRVIGIVLTGALDDGTAGLWTIKHRGGTAIVQDPADAEVPSMPESALREVDVDYCVPIAEMPELIARLVNEDADENSGVIMEENKLTEIEIKIAAEDNAFESGIMNFGELSPFTCPDCHGVLSQYQEGKRTRFRCHTGHAFSANSLLATVTESVEEGLWSAIRGIEESVMLLNHLGNHYVDLNQADLAALYFKKALEAEQRAQFVREAVMKHEQLSKEQINQQSGNGRGARKTEELSEVNK
jgi:two-component system, chemotaxis family, protein-glutamate methylesterase/glutaminase